MKKSNVLEYKGYHTKIEFYANDNVLRGKIEGHSFSLLIALKLNIIIS